MKKTIKNNTAGNAYVIYCRVSTVKQGLGLEAQENICREYITTHNGTALKVISEKESGKLDNRAGLHEAIRLCRENGASLIIARLDRLSRHNSFLLTFSEEMQTAGIRWIVANDETISNDILRLSIFGALAQKEREDIADKTRIALQALKAKGKKLGGKRTCSDGQTNTQKMIEAAANTNKQLANDWAQRNCPVICAMRKNGMTLQAIADACNSQGMRTCRNSLFTPKAIDRILQRCGYCE